MSGSGYKSDRRAVPVVGGVVFTSKPDHTCPKPPVDEWEYGDVFQCDKCKRQYTLHDDQREGRYWT